MKLKSAKPPVDRGLILICEKCGKKLSGADDSISRELQKNLKEKCKEEFGKEGVRPLVSSCMNVCPENEIAVGVIRFGKANEFFTISKPDSEREVEEIWTELKNKF